MRIRWGWRVNSHAEHALSTSRFCPRTSQMFGALAGMLSGFGSRIPGISTAHRCRHRLQTVFDDTNSEAGCVQFNRRFSTGVPVIPGMLLNALIISMETHTSFLQQIDTHFRSPYTPL